VSPYVQPAHRYAPGHRGIDLLPLGEATVASPADGVIAFAGSVADRDLVTIDHGDGLVTTLEPVTSELAPGDAVASGEAVGRISLGGHAPPGAVHFGVRLDGEYVNPLLLLGGIPRAVLLPCCDPLGR
jgi:murein DD-endopeptidase MepM/ murein hydrolase activator NlpD